MPKLIKQGSIKLDNWVRADKATSSIEGSHVLVHCADWDNFEKQPDVQYGIWLDSSDTIASLPAGIDNLAVIAINFPVLTDGRGFSLARQIREQCNYRGELRAIGQFFQDQVFYMKRCGFDAYSVPDDADLDAYSVTLQSFTDYYQAAADEPRPLFRRRS
jgi:uncharacterized protein (DUF934 family)